VPSPAIDALHSPGVAYRVIRHEPVGVFVPVPGDRAVSRPKLRALLDVSGLSMPGNLAD
jgi:hypothetical protein